MKKEVILFYISSNIINMFLVNKKREIIKEVDTSSFFKFGEISCVKNFKTSLEKIVNEEKVLTGLFKPNLIVLYNDVTYCDLECLYELALLPFNYDKINFVPISNIVKTVNANEKLVFFDKNYYTVFKGNYKTDNKSIVPIDSIFIGKTDDESIHYSDSTILWKTFISHFTKN